MARLTSESLIESLDSCKHLGGTWSTKDLHDLCGEAAKSLVELEQILGLAKSQDEGCISQAMNRARRSEATAGDANLLQGVVSSLRAEIVDLKAQRENEDSKRTKCSCWKDGCWEGECAHCQHEANELDQTLEESR